MITQFQVRADIPLPPPVYKAGRKPKYPIPTLGVGESFFLPGKTSANGVNSLLQHWRKKLGHSYAQRAWVEDGVAGIRIWRTA